MQKRTKILIGAGLLAAVAAWPAAAIAGGDSDEPITGPALERATKAAIDHLGEGTVTDTEVGDEESMYEVEVLLGDGREVDVQLDENFNVVGSEVEGPDDASDDDDSGSSDND